MSDATDTQDVTVQRGRVAGGYVQLYTGDGKGKTTCAIGLIIRALGRHVPVLFVQFMKGNASYGEIQMLRTLPGVTVRQFGSPDFVDPKKPTPVDYAEARAGLTLAAEGMSGGEYGLVVMDEINIAASWNLVPVAEVVAAIRARAKGTEVVCTGRYAPRELIDLADLVTEMRMVKHYYDQGVMAREGIEY